MQDNQFSKRPHSHQPPSRTPEHARQSHLDDDRDDDGPIGAWDELFDFLFYAYDRVTDAFYMAWDYCTTRLSRLWRYWKTGFYRVWDFFTTKEISDPYTRSEHTTYRPRPTEEREDTPVLRRQHFTPTGEPIKQAPPRKSAPAHSQLPITNDQDDEDNFAPRMPLILWFWNLWSRTVWPLTVTTGSVAIALTIYLLLGLLFSEQPLRNQALAAVEEPVRDWAPESNAPMWPKQELPIPADDPFEWSQFPVTPVSAIQPPSNLPTGLPKANLSMQRYYTSWVPNLQLPADNILRVAGRGYYQPAFRYTSTSISSNNAPWRRHIPVSAVPSSPWMEDVGPYYQAGLHFVEVPSHSHHQATAPLDGHLPSTAIISFELKKSLPSELSSTTDATINYQITNVGTSPLNEILIDEELWQPDPLRPQDPTLHDEAEYRVHQLLTGEVTASQAVFPTKNLHGKVHAYAYVTASSQVESVTRVAQHQVDMWITFPMETAVGKPTQGTINLKNIGRTTYPGGTLTIDIPMAFQTQTSFDPEQQINILGPGQSQQINFTVKPASAGNTQIIATLNKDSERALQRFAPVVVLVGNTPPPAQPQPEPTPEPKPQPVPQKPVTTSKPVTQPEAPFFEPDPAPPKPNKPEDPPKPPIEIPKETPPIKNNSSPSPTCCQPCQARTQQQSPPPIQQPVYYPYYEPSYYPVIMPAGYYY